MSKIDVEAFEKDGDVYLLPVYALDKTAGELVQTSRTQRVRMLTGDHEGFLHETVIAMLIDDLKIKQSKQSCKETAMVITKLEEGLQWQHARKRRMDKEKNQ